MKEFWIIFLKLFLFFIANCKNYVGIQQFTDLDCQKKDLTETVQDYNVCIPFETGGYKITDKGEEIEQTIWYEPTCKQGSTVSHSYLKGSCEEYPVNEIESILVTEKEEFEYKGKDTMLTKFFSDENCTTPMFGSIFYEKEDCKKYERGCMKVFPGSNKIICGDSSFP